MTINDFFQKNIYIYIHTYMPDIVITSETVLISAVLNLKKCRKNDLCV